MRPSFSICSASKGGLHNAGSKACMLWHRWRSNLKDISLGVQKGCIVTIVGPNGCGKSTLLKIISRILRPQSGEVLLDGCDVRTANTRSLARRMAILPQRKNVAVDLTVEQLVQYGRYPHTGFGGKLTKRDIDKVDEAMHAAGIETLRNRAIGTLSGGESQMAWSPCVLPRLRKSFLLDDRRPIWTFAISWKF